MLTKKMLIVILAIMLFACNFIFSNELNSQKSLLSSNDFNFRSRIVKYSTDDPRRGGFIGMGIAGSVIVGVCALAVGGGVGMYVYAYYYVQNALIAADWDYTDSSALNAASNVVGLWYGGIAMMAIGCVIMFFSIPLIAIGFAIANSLRNKNKVSFFIDVKNEKALNAGFTIKL